jgi:hypothetical protein
MKHYHVKSHRSINVWIELTWYAFRTVKAIMSQEISKMIYFSYRHCGMTYGIIFWGNLPTSLNIFSIKKRIIRIITNSRNRGCCRELFKNLKILPLYLYYIFSLFVIGSKKQKLIFNLATFQRGANYFGVVAFIHLPSSIKTLSNGLKLFRPTLKRFILSNSFYSIDEYFNCSTS